jgi:hypothetical protein
MMRIAKEEETESTRKQMARLPLLHLLRLLLVDATLL